MNVNIHEVKSIKFREIWDLHESYKIKGTRECYSTAIQIDTTRGERIRIDLFGSDRDIFDDLIEGRIKVIEE